MFLPPAWPRFSTSRKFVCSSFISLPYLFLYLSAYTDPGTITRGNHAAAMELYPYDFTNFFPGHKCPTCRLLKPARSKHCSICKTCISRLDHHCIFINNCVGYGNHHWFLLLLFTTFILTSYAVHVGLELSSAHIRERLPSWTLSGTGWTWNQYFHILAWELQEQTRIGAVTLLCILTTPLVLGLFTYHVYLLWAGTTTNESMKWSDWRADIADGFAFQRQLERDRARNPSLEPRHSTWPVECRTVLLRTEGKAPPEHEIGRGEWEQVWRLADVENIYDVGLFDTLRDIFLARSPPRL